MSDVLRWGILGTGRIAAKLAEAIKASPNNKLVAVGSRSQASADQFADTWNAPNRHDSYDGVLGDADVDVVYISLPNDLHAPWSIRCAQAGKHILCEKPMAMTGEEAETVIAAAKKNDVFFMEAFMYRCHPQTAKLAELIKEETIGTLRLIQSTFSFGMDAERITPGGDVRLFNHMGGGAIMDVGCYTMSLSRLIAGSAVGKDFADPIEVQGTAAFFEPKGSEGFVDLMASAAVKFANKEGERDIVAALACGMNAWCDRTFTIYGDAGTIKIPDPWFAHECLKIEIHRGDEVEVINIEDDTDQYILEVETVRNNIPNRQPQAPAHTWADALSNMHAIDKWRHSAGLKWVSE